MPRALPNGLPSNDHLIRTGIALPDSRALTQLRRLTGAYALMAALVLTCAAPGCATQQPSEASENCGQANCLTDEQITSEVRALLAQHPELQGPDQLYVNTEDHVVHLSGMVGTGLHRDIAGSLAEQAKGVTRVVNSISIEK